MSNHLNKAVLDLFFRKPKRVKRWLEEFLRATGKEAVKSQKSHKATEEPLSRKASGLFSLARWRRHPKPNDKPRETIPASTPCPTAPAPAPAPAPAAPAPSPSPAPTPPSAHAPATDIDIDVDVDTDTDRTATDPHSLPATPSMSGQGSSSSVTKKMPLGVSSLLDEKERAPPAGEKGRFIEHFPEANHEQWLGTSQLLG